LKEVWILCISPTYYSVVVCVDEHNPYRIEDQKQCLMYISRNIAQFQGFFDYWNLLTFSCYFCKHWRQIYLCKLTEEIEEGLIEYFTIFLKILWIIFAFFRIIDDTTKLFHHCRKKRSIKSSIECKDFMINRRIQHFVSNRSWWKLS
jgi:hypothetical protein